MKFAIPNGTEGSGLTFLVGVNNSGKTSILESIKYFMSDPDSPMGFSEGKRNRKTDYKVKLLLTDNSNRKFIIETTEYGGSTTRFYEFENDTSVSYDYFKIFTLPSRRFSDYEFHKGESSRFDYSRNQMHGQYMRRPILDTFSDRLFKMQKNREKFDTLVKEILGDDLEWTIEERDNGQFYLKFKFDESTHSSEGVGDGIWSVFTICDALYDSEPNSTILIDEPELSLHPAYQKRVLEMLKKYSENTQIIISTHSPYFVDWESILNGANLIRTVKNKSSGDTEVFHLSDTSKENINKFMNNYDQPHTLGLDAKEIFFLEDGIIVVEGQDDVITYPRIASGLDLKFEGEFFGWGAGGAGNIQYILEILEDLRFDKVAIILDKDKESEVAILEQKFKKYNFYVIPTDDVRYKRPRKASDGKEGLLDPKTKKIYECYKDIMTEMIKNINKSLNRI